MSKNVRQLDLPCELRIRLADGITDDLELISKYTGMDYSNITRMALIEFVNNHKEILKKG